MQKVARLQDQILAVAELHQFILCTRRLGGTAHVAVGGGQARYNKLSSNCGNIGPKLLWKPFIQIPVPLCYTSIIKYLFTCSFHYRCREHK